MPPIGVVRRASMRASRPSRESSTRSASGPAAGTIDAQLAAQLGQRGAQLTPQRRVQRPLVQRGGRLRLEGRVVARRQRQVELGRALAEQVDLGRRPAEHGALAQLGRRLLEVEVELVEHVGPRVALVGAVAVGEGHRVGAVGPAPAQRAEQRGPVVVADLAQVAGHLQLEVLAVLQPAQQLHHDLVVDHDRRVRLLDRQDADVVLVGGQGGAQRRLALGDQRPSGAPHRHRPHQLDDRRLVLDGVDDRAGRRPGRPPPPRGGRCCTTRARSPSRTVRGTR